MNDKAREGAGGRPTIYSQELADELCLRIANGKSLNAVCKADDMPSKSLVYIWIANNSEFLDKYREATKQREDFHFDEMLDIADSVEPESSEIAKAKLKIDTRKWVLSRMNPRKYGDKPEADEEESNAQPVEVIVNVRDARKP